MFLASPVLWSLPTEFSVSVSLTASCNALFRAHLASQASYWNRGRSFSDSTTLHACKISSLWTSQGLFPAKAVTVPPWIVAAFSYACLNGWALWTESKADLGCHSLSPSQWNGVLFSKQCFTFATLKKNEILLVPCAISLTLMTSSCLLVPHLKDQSS